MKNKKYVTRDFRSPT